MNGPGREHSLFSIVIPVFNEEGAVLTVVKRAHEIFPGAEIIVVDDGSVDGTARVLADAPVRVISHEENRGYGAAIKTGIAAARHDIVVTIDADGEHVPEDIALLLKGLNDADMVVGARCGGCRCPLSIKSLGRMVLNEVACFLSSSRIPDINSGLRVFRKDAVVGHLDFFPNTFSFHTTSTLAILFSGGRIRYVPVKVAPRVGVSKVRIWDGVVSLAFVTRLAWRWHSARVVVGILSMAGLIGGLSGLLCSLGSVSRWMVM
ncbi:MAG: glycosyltransferase family 2 protein, partial [Candidatus Omnitrophica bacterium]|nr:glycosyltransferase family 2 protein [Candidatus Omnitrophota bacterium]